MREYTGLPHLKTPHTGAAKNYGLEQYRVARSTFASALPYPGINSCELTWRGSLQRIPVLKERRPRSRQEPPPDGIDFQVSCTEILGFQECNHIYCMQTFWQWLWQLRLCPLDETYFTFDPAEYNQLFDKELEKVITRTSNAKHCQALESMRGFNWMGCQLKRGRIPRFGELQRDLQTAQGGA
jgi:hypothetical protein